jgi:hypothetical protein
MKQRKMIKIPTKILKENTIYLLSTKTWHLAEYSRYRLRRWRIECKKC